MRADFGMNNKNVLITGATNGIGRATAMALAHDGANLFILCRNPTKGEELCHEIRATNPKGAVQLLIADLGDLEQVRCAAKAFQTRNIPLDVLINNAGVLNTSRVLLPNGLEQMFAVNHLGHFLLTRLLMPALERPKAARIVVVASDAYKLCKSIQFENLSWDEGFKTFKTYAHSKLANILFMRALAERLADTTVTVNALDPGAVSTNLGAQNGPWTARLIRVLSPLFSTSSRGARTTLHLARSPEIAGVSGQYFGNCKPRQTKPWANDKRQAEKLWRVSENLVEDQLSATF